MNPIRMAKLVRTLTGLILISIWLPVIFYGKSPGSPIYLIASVFFTLVIITISIAIYVTLLNSNHKKSGNRKEE